MKKSITVFGEKFKVKTNKRNSSTDGEVNFSKKEIWVSPEQSREQMWRTFYHEFTHCVQYRSGVFHSGLTIEVVEMMAETQANAIYELIEQLAPGFHDG